MEGMDVGCSPAMGRVVGLDSVGLLFMTRIGRISFLTPERLRRLKPILLLPDSTFSTLFIFLLLLLGCL